MKPKVKKINIKAVEKFLNEEMNEIKGGAAGGPVCHCDSGAAAIKIGEPVQPSEPVLV
ncbi:MAG: hypothetical protein WDA68_10250 [Phycisphaerae bacterium]|nr:hypothetical protein [Candidatus Paceibacterota bacterium]